MAEDNDTVEVQAPPGNDPGNGEGPPENPSNRSEKFGTGKPYKCPDCNGPTSSYFDGDKQIPKAGWQNYILTSDESAITIRTECKNCDWYDIKTLVVRDQGGA